jgi:ribulose-5-phosphate 4-epimerase/fuculose-1-phosphate aldolase
LEAKVKRLLLKWLGAAALVCAAAVPASAQSDAANRVVAAAARLGVAPTVVENLVVANRILANEGILDAYGHVSVRDPRNPNRYLIARSVAPEFVTAADILRYDLDSNPIDANAPAGFIERYIHGEIYKARPDVMAIIHTHSAPVIPFSVSTVPLRPVFHMASFLADGVPVWDPESSGDPAAAQILVRNPALGASLAATLGKRTVALMRGHGAVIATVDVIVAVKDAIYLDANARMQSAAIALGGPIKYISPQEAHAMEAAVGDINRAWDYWRRRAFPPK